MFEFGLRDACHQPYGGKSDHYSGIWRKWRIDRGQGKAREGERDDEGLKGRLYADGADGQTARLRPCWAAAQLLQMWQLESTFLEISLRGVGGRRSRL